MKTALFTNFTEEEFTGFWDGKGKTYKPGQSQYMPSYLAEHFATHLVNRELLRRDSKGELLISSGDKYVSPKHPEDVPVFMNLFQKAYKPEPTADGEEESELDTLINAANKNKTVEKQEEHVGSDELQTPTDDDEEPTEESFGGQPVELEKS